MAMKQKTLRILIVEDDVDHANTLSLLLDNSSYESTVCQDARDCITSMENLRPDVVLLDLGMPGMTGYEIAEAIKRHDDWRHIRLLAITGHGLPLDRLQTKMSGFDEHLLKPVCFAELDRILKSIQDVLAMDRAEGSHGEYVIQRTSETVRDWWTGSGWSEHLNEALQFLSKPDAAVEASDESAKAIRLQNVDD
jgi:CheY-like chemotaxis protein